MLDLGWSYRGGVDSGVPMVKVIDHIDHICQLAGNARHVAIGSDLDGGYGREQSPNDLDTIADLQQIGPMLAARGYAPADIAAIMHGNWVALLRRGGAVDEARMSWNVFGITLQGMKMSVLFPKLHFQELVDAR